MLKLFYKGTNAGTGPKVYHRCRQILAANLGKRRLTRHRSALPANPTSSRPRSWSVGNATLVVAKRSGWRRALGASKPRPSAKGAHPYRKRACLEALRLATTKLTQRGTGYPSCGHPTQLRISRGSTGLIDQWQLRRERGKWIQVLVKIGVWNVRGLYGKEKLLLEELRKTNVDIAVIPKTKQKKITGFARVGRLYFIVQRCANE